MQNKTALFNPLTKILAFLFLILMGSESFAQNSPYSAHGLGNPVNGNNAVNAAMGGLSQAYSDAQSINFGNPASYSGLQLTTLDVGLSLGTTNLREGDTSGFRSGMGALSYLQIGVPLKKGGGWGLVFGLTPETKINYNVSKSDTLPNVGESASFLYRGKGGAYKAYFGTAYRLKGLSVGVNMGYLFGSRQRNAQIVYPAKTGSPLNSNEEIKTGYGGFFGDAGIQARIKLAKDMNLQLGASGGLKTSLHADQSRLLETATYSGDPADQSPQNQDTVSFREGIKGTINYPAHYGLGVLFQSNKGKSSWSIGADYKTTQWSDYSYYGSNEGLTDSRLLNFGVQLVPASGAEADRTGTKYWGMVSYRLGFYTNKKNFKSNGKDVNEHAFTFGLGLPLRNFTRTNQFTLMNLAFEIGKMGNKSNELNMNFFRFTLGFSLSDIWFIDRRYQ